MSKVYKICNCVESANGIAFGGGGGGGGYPVSQSAVNQQANHNNLPNVSKDCGYAVAAAVGATATTTTGAGAAVAWGNAAYQCNK